MSLEELRRFLPPPPGLLRLSDGLATAHAAAARFVGPMALPRRTRHGLRGGLSTLLLVGEAGSGRTASGSTFALPVEMSSPMSTPSVV